MSSQEFSNQQYIKITQEILDQLIQVLDQHVVVKIIKNVEGLSVSEEGKVLNIEGSGQDVMQLLIDKLLGLSNEIVIKTLKPLLTQCPWIKIPPINKQ